ncbi:hypothetical protein [Chryseobacterium sp. 2987]|uniref:hypothetical protein n=1 Tax=Chryseobacterium sp. 2987 TaxID=2817767 RepID=UPI00285E7469|nr:hypothetical protein [Chryseobacterium sp. 2987]MDR6920046.1 hypothetical protein [Chryseobacterium sp. 2987]
MIQKIIITTLLLFFCFSLGQKKNSKVNTPEHGKLNKNFKPLALSKRIAKFPFNQAVKVKIISFNLKLLGKSLPSPPPPTAFKTNEEYLRFQEAEKKLRKPIELEDFIKNPTDEDIQESKILTLAEISELTNILYNTCSKYYLENKMGNKCYFPRNAVLFYDENDQIFAYFEVCFECSGSRSFPDDQLNFIETCEYLYPELEKFFKSKGLTTQFIGRK